jgi:predicted Zn-dependent peptidase
MRRFTTALLIIVFLTFLPTICLAGTAITDINLDIKEFTLENGMQFLVVERHTTPQVAMRVAIRAGSALEETGKTGIAHMLEHMLFKGTKNFGTRDYERDQQLQEQIEGAYQAIRAEQKKRKPDHDLIEQKRSEMSALRQEVQNIYVAQTFSAQLGKNGAVGVNAFTTQDQTQYTMSVPSDMIEQWFSIVSEQLFEPSWREFYVEKEVVQREWAFRYVNNPNGAAWLDLYATAYTAHPYRNPVIGWKSDMEKFNTRDAAAFHGKYYTPTNAVAVLVGDVTPARAKQLAEIYFGRYPGGDRSPEHVTAEPPQQGPRKRIHWFKGTQTPLVRIGFHGAQMGSPDFYALDALTMVLSHGRSARLTQEVVDKGLAVDAWAYNPDNRYGGLLILGGSPNEPEALKNRMPSESESRLAYQAACESLEKTLLEQLDRMKNELVSQKELERIKKLNHRDFIDRMRSNEDLAGTIATMEVQAGWEYLTGYLQHIAMVTPEDIRRVARQYARDDNRTTIYVIPGGTPDQPPENYMEIRSLGGSAARLDTAPETLRNHSDHPTPAGWKHPLSFERNPSKIEYPAGDVGLIEDTKVFFLQDNELPLIDLVLLIKAGAVDTGDDHTGLTDLLDTLLIRGGTRTYSPADLAVLLDEHAIQVSASVGDEDTAIHLSVMKEDWHKGLEILQEILTHPRFDPHLLDVLKTRHLTSLRRQNENAQAVAMREGNVWQFKGHPYGRNPLKGLETIPGIERKDFKEFVRKYFVPSNMVVAVAGDIDREAVMESLKDFLHALPSADAPGRHIEDPAETPPILTLVHKPGQVQSQVNLRLPSVKRTHPDFWRVNLLMSIFGGNDSMLYRRLRDDLGLVYSTWFQQAYKWHAGFLIGYIGCKADQTGDAIKETVHIMESLRKEIPEQELDLKRRDTLNGFIFNVDSPLQLVKVYGRYALRNEPLDTLERIQDAFIEASREKLEKLATTYLDPKKLQITVVADKTTKVFGKNGPEQTIEEELKQLAVELGLTYREMTLDTTDKKIHAKISK